MEVDPMDQVAQFLENGPLILQWILMALGGLVVGGYAYIKATPNQSDDQWLQSLESKPIIGFVLRLLVRLAPVQRKKEDKPKPIIIKPDENPL